jgi:hypothetical protein
MVIYQLVNLSTGQQVEQYQVIREQEKSSETRSNITLLRIAQRHVFYGAFSPAPM